MTLVVDFEADANTKVGRRRTTPHWTVTSTLDTMSHGRSRGGVLKWRIVFRSSWHGQQSVAISTRIRISTTVQVGLFAIPRTKTGVPGNEYLPGWRCHPLVTSRRHGHIIRLAGHWLLDAYIRHRQRGLRARVPWGHTKSWSLRYWTFEFRFGPSVITIGCGAGYPSPWADAMRVMGSLASRLTRFAFTNEARKLSSIRTPRPHLLVELISSFTLPLRQTAAL